MVSANLGNGVNGLSLPRAVYSDGLRVFIGDAGNYRLLLSPLP